MKLRDYQPPSLLDLCLGALLILGVIWVAGKVWASLHPPAPIEQTIILRADGTYEIQKP